MSENEKVTLANLAGGRAVEMFDAELERVLENIADHSTKVKTARKVTLTVSIVPTETRDVGVVEIAVDSKLASGEPVPHTIEFGQEGKRQVAYQRREKQGELFQDSKVFADMPRLHETKGKGA